MESLGEGLSLGANEVALIGAVIGGLWGSIWFLLKIVVSAKDAQIELLKDTVQSVERDRDYYRDRTLRSRDD